MKKRVYAFDLDVKEYLKEEFGGFQENGGVMMPLVGVLIEVVEPIKTGHDYCGEGLDGDNCVPSGIYKVGALTHISPLGVSCQGELLTPLGEEKVVCEFCAGYAGQVTMDWLGCKKVVL